MFKLLEQHFSIPQEELDQISDIATTIHAIHNERGTPETVYHYTTSTGLMGIIDQAKLRASHIAFMNDAKEYAYGAELLNKIITEKMTPETTHEGIIEVIYQFIRPEKFSLAHYMPCFVACFTSKRDDLSQWRAYGGGEGGFAIGFDTANLLKVFKGKLCYASYVLYDPRKQHEYAEVLINKTMDLYNRHLAVHHGDDGYSERWYEAWRAVASCLAPLVKYPAFLGEDEWRIVYIPATPSEFHFQDSFTSIRPFVEVEIDPGTLIKEVLVGPGPSKDLNKIALDMLLGKKGISVCNIEISQIPYRVA